MVDLRWVNIRPYNFFVSGPKFTNFFAERGRDDSRSSLFPVVDILIHFTDIRSQSLKLSKIARAVDFGWVHIGQCNLAVCRQKFTNFFPFNSEGIVVDDICLKLLISGPVLKIFAVKVKSCTKSRRILNVFCSPKF